MLQEGDGEWEGLRMCVCVGVPQIYQCYGDPNGNVEAGGGRGTLLITEGRGTGGSTIVPFTNWEFENGGTKDQSRGAALNYRSRGDWVSAGKELHHKFQLRLVKTSSQGKRQRPLACCWRLNAPSQQAEIRK